MRVTGNETASSKQAGRAGHAGEMKKVDRPEKSSTSEVDKKSNSSVNAEISSKSKEMGRAKTIASETPDIREDKVANLKSRIESGNYRVDSDAIADRLVDEHFGFPGVG